MDEYVMKQKIQEAYLEPRAPEELIQQTILRTQAVTMGVQAQKQLESASAEDLGQLASRALIGQLAAVSELPEGTKPEQLANLLEQEPAFQAALLGGNVARRLSSGELMQQVAAQEPAVEQDPPELSVPIKEGPVLG
jgi:hypothetical protein